MHTPRENGDRQAREVSEDERPGMADDRRRIRVRNVAVGNVNGILDQPGQRAEAAAGHDTEGRDQARLGADVGRRGVESGQGGVCLHCGS